ncbi:MAG: HipA N-terminal domain-containing protein [Candidatus Omnitrophica bacterium]|nr:HipA N-terminal domain-containing protein [Candidatus Omnitrophota bacterium]
MSQEPFRRAKVKYKDQVAGYLSETAAGYRFQYDPAYLRTGVPISISLPLREEPYESRELFSFFRGLLPEGWYLAIVSATAKIDAQDAFGILLATTPDTIGAVTVHKVEE